MKVKIKSFFMFLLSFVIVFTVFGWGSNSAGASNQEGAFILEGIVIKKDPNYVSLDWNDVTRATNYVVKYEDEVVYFGRQSEFIHKNLEEGSLGEYHLVAIDKNEAIIDDIYLKIFTPIEDKEYGNVGVDAIANEKSIFLDWPSVEGAKEYNIYRDEKFIGTTANDFYLDENLNEENKYEYTIETKIEFTEERLQEAKDQILVYVKEAEKEELTEGEIPQSYEIEEAFAELEDNAYDIVEISTPVYTLTKETNSLSLNQFINSGQMSTMAALPASTWIKINTMILNTANYRGYLPGPGISKYYFATDKRTTITSSGSTRSSLTAKINWSDRSTTPTKSVGWTERYTKNANGNYVYVDRRKASDNNVYFGVTKKTQSMVDINFLHKAANPYYSVAPNVEYEFRSEIYRDGTTKMRGYHTLFPSLGIFRSDGSGYRTLYTHNQGTRTPWSLYSHKTIDIVK